MPKLAQICFLELEQLITSLDISNKTQNSIGLEIRRLSDLLHSALVLPFLLVFSAVSHTLHFRVLLLLLIFLIMSTFQN